MYKTVEYKGAVTGVLRLTDGAGIPADPANTDYAAYQQWLAEGNTPEPADQPSPQDAIKAQIAALEATVTPRRMREAVLGTDSGWLADVDAQIAALRAQL